MPGVGGDTGVCQSPHPMSMLYARALLSLVLPNENHVDKNHAAGGGRHRIELGGCFSEDARRKSETRSDEGQGSGRL